MPSAIQLLVGLGNPGPKYQSTRHNVGAWLIEALAHQINVVPRLDAKFSGTYAKATVDSQLCHLLCPTTYMNDSGRAVQALANFFKIPVEAICIAHDDLDLPAGTIRLKQGGGHGGHNGLRDIVACLNSPAFARIRIGIGHPGHKDKVLDYVLAQPNRTERELIEQGIQETLDVMPAIVAGDFAKAMQQLHTRE